jgi:hypothetical protein
MLSLRYLEKRYEVEIQRFDMLILTSNLFYECMAKTLLSTECKYARDSRPSLMTTTNRTMHLKAEDNDHMMMIILTSSSISGYIIITFFSFFFSFFYIF